jgi:ABC-type phosphate/phosphonate transport system substrate-binding protein
MREEVTDIVPNERVGYTLLSGFPLLDYRSRTTLERTAAGTRIVWESSFCPKYPLTAWYWRRLMAWVLRRLVRSLAETAEDPERRSRILSLAQGKTFMRKRALGAV